MTISVGQFVELVVKLFTAAPGSLVGRSACYTRASALSITIHNAQTETSRCVRHRPLRTPTCWPAAVDYNSPCCVSKDMDQLAPFAVLQGSVPIHLLGIHLCRRVTPPPAILLWFTSTTLERQYSMGPSTMLPVRDSLSRNPSIFHVPQWRTGRDFSGVRLTSCESNSRRRCEPFPACLLAAEASASSAHAVVVSGLCKQRD